MSVLYLVLSICTCLLVAPGCSSQHTSCPIWHRRLGDSCECGDALGDSGTVLCSVDGIVTVSLGYCMTLDSTTQSPVVSHCPLPNNVACVFGKVQFTANVSGPEISNVTCKQYNRQGSRCSQCIDGYGPAAFSDGFTCADCNSQHSHLWFLNLLLQLTMVTLMYVVVVLFQIKGTSSPLNVIITYAQLCVCAVKISVGVRMRIVCFLGPALTSIVLSVVSVVNLDFFHFVLPPMCISPSLRSISVFLFDYIVALFPILLTIFLYIIIELHDRNCWIIYHFTVPVKKLFTLFRTRWNPKTTILNTCITFLLLAYSKLLFTSINLIFAVRAYNSEGEVVPNSTVLLYDPSIRFFHREHIPYAVLSLFVIVVCVLLPPLLLLCYPTRLFRVCLNWCGFKRWDILHLIADVFQGWFKDGTGGSRDFRALSSLYLLFRVIFGSIFVILFISKYKRLYSWCVIGMGHIFIGSFFLVAKPYKKKWMNFVDGIIVDMIGVLILTAVFDNKQVFFIAFVIHIIVVFLILCFVGLYMCLHKCHLL